MTVKSLEAKARRVARSVGLVAKKSRSMESIDNLRGFMLINDRNYVVAGSRFDMSAQDIIDFCNAY